MAGQAKVPVVKQPRPLAEEPANVSGQQSPDRRWLLDALEDDEVREALKELHERSG